MELNQGNQFAGCVYACGMLFLYTLAACVAIWTVRLTVGF